MEIALIVTAVVLCGFVLFAAWVWRGIWLAKNVSGSLARTRWHWYVQCERRIRKWKLARRVKKLHAQGLDLKGTPLKIDKAEHRSAVEYRLKRERGRRG